MAVRSTMANLISRIRYLISDTGTSPQFADQQVQDVADEMRVDAWYELLTARGTRPPGGGLILYLDYYHEYGNWEDDIQLVDGTYNVLQPYNMSTNPGGYVSENIVGHWKFGSTVNWPVYATGKYFDIHGIAAKLCRQWAASVKLEFAFATEGVRYARDQQYKALMDLAEAYERKAWPQSITTIRDDVASDANNSALAGYFFQDPNSGGPR